MCPVRPGPMPCAGAPQRTSHPSASPLPHPCSAPPPNPQTPRATPCLRPPLSATSPSTRSCPRSTSSQSPGTWACTRWGGAPPTCLLTCTHTYLFSKHTRTHAHAHLHTHAQTPTCERTLYTQTNTHDSLPLTPPPGGVFPQLGRVGRVERKVPRRHTALHKGRGGWAARRGCLVIAACFGLDGVPPGGRGWVSVALTPLTPTRPLGAHHARVPRAIGSGRAAPPATDATTTPLRHEGRAGDAHRGVCGPVPHQRAQALPRRQLCGGPRRVQPLRPGGIQRQAQQRESVEGGCV